MIDNFVCNTTFIIWQFDRLQGKGYLGQAEHDWRQQERDGNKNMTAQQDSKRNLNLLWMPQLTFFIFFFLGKGYTVF